MAKKNKKQDVQVDPDASKKDNGGYISKYFQGAIWTNSEGGSVHLIQLGDSEALPSSTMSLKILELVEEVQQIDSLAFCLLDGWGVSLSCAKIVSTSFFELSNVFVRIWIDNFVDRLSETLYIGVYKEVMNDQTIPLSKREKEADKKATEVQKGFLLKCL